MLIPQKTAVIPKRAPPAGGLGIGNPEY